VLAVSGRYLAAAEFHGAEPTLTIRDLEMQVLAEPDGSERECLVALFAEDSLPWVVNQTNQQLLAAMFGPAQAGWLGKRVTLAAQRVELEEGYCLGIRVKGSPHLVDDITAPVRLRKYEPYFVRLVPTRVSWLRKAG
jgi:hypothetical protein